MNITLSEVCVLCGRGRGRSAESCVWAEVEIPPCWILTVTLSWQWLKPNQAFKINYMSQWGWVQYLKVIYTVTVRSQLIFSRRESAKKATVMHDLTPHGLDLFWWNCYDYEMPWERWHCESDIHYMGI